MASDAGGGAVSVLVLGGLGMIGRSVVKYLLDYDLANYIRVADKAVKQTSWLDETYQRAFADPRVEVRQMNLSSPAGVDAAFAPNDKCPLPFNVVIALAAETAYSMPEVAYEMNITQLRVLCAQKAASLGTVERYIEVSTAQVYAGDSASPRKESDATNPWTLIGAAHLKAEQVILSTCPTLNVIILRLPLVYGPADRTALLPRLTCAAVYKHVDQEMQFLWGEELRMHTVHVQDAAAAIYHLISSGQPREIYNLADDNDTSQGKFNAIIERIFRIRTSFLGTIKMSIALAVSDMQQLVDDANDDLMAPWGTMCKQGSVDRTPLLPFLDKEVVSNHHVSVDASKIKATGFRCSCPTVTADLVLASLQYWVRLAAFPNNLVPTELR